MSDTNVAYAILIRHKIMSNSEVKILSAAIATVCYLFIYLSIFDCRSTLPDSKDLVVYKVFFADSESGS